MDSAIPFPKVRILFGRLNAAGKGVREEHRFNKESFAQFLKPANFVGPQDSFANTASAECVADLTRAEVSRSYE